MLKYAAYAEIFLLYYFVIKSETRKKKLISNVTVKPDTAGPLKFLIGVGLKFPVSKIAKNIFFSTYDTLILQLIVSFV